MKFFLCIATFCAFIAGILATPPTLTTEEQARLEEVSGLCYANPPMPINLTDVQQLLAFNFTTLTTAQKCFLNCAFEYFGTFEDYELQYDFTLEKMTERIGATNAAAIMSTCSAVTNTADCDYAFNVFMCYMAQGAPVIVPIPSSK